jgi:hypothetical protein
LRKVIELDELLMRFSRTSLRQLPEQDALRNGNNKIEFRVRGLKI